MQQQQEAYQRAQQEAYARQMQQKAIVRPDLGPSNTGGVETQSTVSARKQYEALQRYLDARR